MNIGLIVRSNLRKKIQKNRGHTEKVFFRHIPAKYHLIFKVKDSLVISVTKYTLASSK